VIHELVRKITIIADYIDLVTLCGMDHIINGNVFFKQATMCMVVAILSAEEKTAAPLGIEVPKKNAQTSFSKKAGQIYGCGGFSNASLDIVYGDLFQRIL